MTGCSTEGEGEIGAEEAILGFWLLEGAIGSPPPPPGCIWCSFCGEAAEVSDILPPS